MHSHNRDGLAKYTPRLQGILLLYLQPVVDRKVITLCVTAAIIVTWRRGRENCFSNLRQPSLPSRAPFSSLNRCGYSQLSTHLSSAPSLCTWLASKDSCGRHLALWSLTTPHRTLPTGSPEQAELLLHGACSPCSFLTQLFSRLAVQISAYVLPPQRVLYKSPCRDK